MNRAKCPETKEQWEHRQSQIRRVVDPETGRIRSVFFFFSLVWCNLFQVLSVFIKKNVFYFMGPD